MKPVIVGMNNPLSRRPEHALYPHPPGCTGFRLWRMLNARTGASEVEYLEAFDRMNLVSGAKWSQEAANVVASVLVEGLRGRVVLLLGVAVRRAFAVPPLLVHPQELYGVTWRQLPHPSGRCRWYNDPENRKVAEVLMQDLYVNGGRS